MRPTGIRSSTRRGGFTLIELALVAGIIAVLAAFAAPRFAGAANNYRATAAARRIANDLQLAQSQARTSGKAQSVTFDSTNNAYSVTGVKRLDGRSGTYSVSISSEPYRASLSASFGVATSITFSPYGSASAAGSVTVRAGGAQRVVSVDRDSGRVTTQ